MSLLRILNPSEGQGPLQVTLALGMIPVCHPECSHHLGYQLDALIQYGELLPYSWSLWPGRIGVFYYPSSCLIRELPKMFLDDLDFSLKWLPMYLLSITQIVLNDLGGYRQQILPSIFWKLTSTYGHISPPMFLFPSSSFSSFGPSCLWIFSWCTN